MCRDDYEEAARMDRIAELVACEYKQSAPDADLADYVNDPEYVGEFDLDAHDAQERRDELSDYEEIDVTGVGYDDYDELEDELDHADIPF